MTTPKPTTIKHNSAITSHHTLCARETKAYQGGRPHGSLWVELFIFKLGLESLRKEKPL